MKVLIKELTCCVSGFFHCCGRIHDKSCQLAPSLKVLSVKVGMPWQPKWEAAGYTACTVRKEKEENAVVQLASSLLMSGTHGMVLFTFRVNLHNLS